eukprot:8795139-Pyramimonas_sp.AAC.1
MATQHVCAIGGELKTLVPGKLSMLVDIGPNMSSMAAAPPESSDTYPDRMDTCRILRIWSSCLMATASGVVLHYAANSAP